MTETSPSSLHEIRLRYQLDYAKAKLGDPDSIAYTPDGVEPKLGTYSWEAAGISILTWVTDGDEYVWGIRLDRPGLADPMLGFSVGSTREEVLARYPDGWSEEPESLVRVHGDGRLTIYFDGERVSCIQLMAPMQGAE